MNRNGKIYIISHTESPLTVRGKRHTKIAAELSLRGWPVEYVTTDFDHARKLIFSPEEQRGAQERTPYRLHFFHVGFYRKHISLARFLWHVCAARKFKTFLEERLTSSDTLVLPPRPVELVRMAWQLKRKTGVKVVLDILDIWPDCLPISNPAVRRLFGWYCWIMLLRGLRSFDGFTHVSPAFIEWLHRYAPGKTSRFIPLGFDEKRWTKWAVSVPHQYLTLVFCGALTGNAPLLSFLKAMAMIPSLRVHILGDDGSGSRYAEVQDFCKQYLAGRYTLRGVLSPDEVVKCYHESDLCLISVKGKILPTRTYDAIGAGLPIFSVGDTATSHFVREHGFGFWAADEPEAIAESLKQITPERLAEIGARIRSERTQYTHERIIRELSDMIEQFHNDR